MQKNDLVTVIIEDIGIHGEGIGKVDGYTLFIKDAIIGDVVEAKVMKAKKNYGYARLMRIVKPSKHRVEPKCGLPGNAADARFRKWTTKSSWNLNKKKYGGIWNELADSHRNFWNGQWSR